LFVSRFVPDPARPLLDFPRQRSSRFSEVAVFSLLISSYVPKYRLIVVLRQPDRVLPTNPRPAKSAEVTPATVKEAIQSERACDNEAHAESQAAKPK